MEFRECTECNRFVWCESPKQRFHKETGTPCNEFKAKSNINYGAEQYCKEYAKNMREKAVKDERGIIQVSPELWEQTAAIIEKAVFPPCAIGDKVWVYIFSGLAYGIVNNVGYESAENKWIISGVTEIGFPFCVTKVYNSREEAEGSKSI